MLRPSGQRDLVLWDEFGRADREDDEDDLYTPLTRLAPCMTEPNESFVVTEDFVARHVLVVEVTDVSHFAELE